MQDILIKASRSADKIGAEWCKKTRDEEHAVMKKHGLEIVELPPADAKKFVDLTEEKLWAKILMQVAGERRAAEGGVRQGGGVGAAPFDRRLRRYPG